jgi:peptidoglycan/xylan/chitin deacetylase (PgdA/CDA1 family)
MNSAPQLDVFMYHYVRDLPRSRFPRMKAMLLEDFRRQCAWLSATHEMATLETALAFLRGEYTPSRTICLLTFDDGVKEHYTDVMPILAEHGIQGIFFLISGCLEEHVVAPVHMNHVLMASLDWAVYQREFLEALSLGAPDATVRAANHADAAARTYPWDTPDVAQFKYSFNFVLRPEVRDNVVRNLFQRHIGSESEFAGEFYVTWQEARAMQAEGMVMGGHSHGHAPLSTLSEPDMNQDLELCRTLLQRRLSTQAAWPFSYPYGKRDSFTGATVKTLKSLGFDCSFATEPDTNYPHQDLFAIRRLDCRVALERQSKCAA